MLILAEKPVRTDMRVHFYQYVTPTAFWNGYFIPFFYRHASPTGFSAQDSHNS